MEEEIELAEELNSLDEDVEVEKMDKEVIDNNNVEEIIVDGANQTGYLESDKSKVEQMMVQI